MISAEAGDLRRALGPTSWMVLEEVLHASQPADTGSTRACAWSVRDLARRLGLDKDTVARAVQRLVDAGLVSRSQTRTTAGTFARTTYSIALLDGIRLVDRTATPTQSNSTTPDLPTAPVLTSPTTPTLPSTTRTSRNPPPPPPPPPPSPSSQLSFLEL